MSEANVTALVPAQQVLGRREVRVVNDPIPVLDTGRFEHMQRVANVMASCSMMPDALCKEKNASGDLVWLSEKQIHSNCFMVVNQAVRWGMDPFAVAQCVSVVHGKLCYEGKLIAAVINAKLGYDLEYKIEGQGESMRVTVGAALDGKQIVDSQGNRKTIDGTVAEWKTTSTGSPWTPTRGGYARMLRYRGAREWCRVYAPALMLGVYSDDEMENADRRFLAAHDITPATSYEDTRPAVSGPPRSVPSSQPPKETPPAAPADETVHEGEIIDEKPRASSGPPRHVPEKKQEAQPQARSTNGWPDPEEEPSSFLMKVEERLLQCGSAEEMTEVFSEEIQDRAGRSYEDAMSVYERLMRDREPS